MYDIFLNKEEFFRLLSELGFDKSQLDAEFGVLSGIFDQLYLANCINTLPEKIQKLMLDEVDLSFPPNRKAFFERLQVYVTDPKNKVDVDKIMLDSSTKAYEMYFAKLEENSK